MTVNKNITNIKRTPRISTKRGYMLVSAFTGALAPSRDVSHMLLN